METTEPVDGIVLGEIRIIAFNFPPQGWAFCTGQTMSIQQNTALFSLLGNKFGGDGRTTFCLPDLGGRAPIHMDGTDRLRLGHLVGSNTATVTLDDMAAHVHPVYGIDMNADSEKAAGHTWAIATDNQHPMYSTTEPSIDMSYDCLTLTGSGQPHENRQPYIVLNYIIALVGEYPTRG